MAHANPSPPMMYSELFKKRTFKDAFGELMEIGKNKPPGKADKFADWASRRCNNCGLMHGKHACKVATEDRLSQQEVWLLDDMCKTLIYRNTPLRPLIWCTVRDHWCTEKACASRTTNHCCWPIWVTKLFLFFCATLRVAKLSIWLCRANQSFLKGGPSKANLISHGNLH